jgi:hypothetical protein
MAAPAAQTPCEAYCRRSRGCDEGSEAAAVARACDEACAPGGDLASPPEGLLACGEREDCAAIERCVQDVMARELEARIAGGPEAVAARVEGADRPGIAPTGDPPGFPRIPGGTALPAPGGTDAIRVTLLAYETSPEALESLVRGELAARGWSATETMLDRGIRRFNARREGSEVAISIWADGGRALIQTMELAL